MKTQKLKDLKNVGKATLADLHLLGIYTVEKLAEQDPRDLFQKMEEKTNAKQDLCVLDVFAAIIHEAKTGEKTAWWEWTCKRKAKFQSLIIEKDNSIPQ
jgi:hypothetical protein